MLNKNITKFLTLLAVILVASCTLPTQAKTINAAKMPGFNPAHATKTLQAAFDSGAAKVIVPNVGQPWIVTPLKLRSNQTVVFMPGVVILAKKGGFHGRNDCLFTARDVKNLTIIGDGATWRMHKKDYANPKKYTKAEWRHTLQILGCTNVTIEGLTLEKSGGDGIYISKGSHKEYSQNITIRNVICYDNYRQGISVISADHLLMENVIMRNTGGTAPMAGIDFEPNNTKQRLTHITMRNCLTWGNQGSGYQFALGHQDATSEPISITLENCRAIGDQRNPVQIATSNTLAAAPRGHLVFTDCIFRGNNAGGIQISKPAEALKITFQNCTLNRSAMDNHAVSPIQFTGGGMVPNGGVVFKQVTIKDPLGRTPIGSTTPLKNVTGELILSAPHGEKRLDLTQSLLDQWNSQFKRAAQKNRKHATIHSLGDTPAPRIDGNLNDPAWQNATWLTPFVPLQFRRSKQKLAETQAAVTFNQQVLYVAFQCTEPQIDNIKSVGKGRDAKGTWVGDEVELFISTGQSAKPYWHFIINPHGAVWDALVSKGKANLSKNAIQAVASAIGDHKWTVELTIPWSAIGGAPAAGATRRVNLCRKRTPVRQYSSWSSNSSGFIEPFHFGVWKFVESK